MKNNFKIRCSAIGEIMTNDRSGKGMGKTAFSYLERWAKEQVYNRKYEFSSKYTNKGLAVESAAIEIVAERIYNGAFILKNEQEFSNDFMTGTPDILLPDLVDDIKSSWDCFTFPLFDQDIPVKDYYWQVQGYMELTGRKKAVVTYILMDTPEPIIQYELERYFKDQDEWDTEIEKEIRSRHIYSNIPWKYRIKRFEIYRNDEDIQKIKDRVTECRAYIDTL